MSTTEVEPVQVDTVMRYGLYSAPITHAEAVRKYSEGKYLLADVPNDEVKRSIAGLLPAGNIQAGWIVAWKGDHYGGAPIALFDNGNIVINDVPDIKAGTFVMWVGN